MLPDNSNWSQYNTYIIDTTDIQLRFFICLMPFLEQLFMCLSVSPNSVKTENRGNHWIKDYALKQI